MSTVDATARRSEHQPSVRTWRGPYGDDGWAVVPCPVSGWKGAGADSEGAALADATRHREDAEAR